MCAKKPAEKVNKAKTLATLTKRKIVEQVAKAVGLPCQKTQEVVQVFLEHITHALHEGQRVEFRGFGSFEGVLRKSKLGRNMHTGGPVAIPAYTTVKFTPGNLLRTLKETKNKDSKKKN